MTAEERLRGELQRSESKRAAAIKLAEEARASRHLPQSEKYPSPHGWAAGRFQAILEALT